MIWLLPLLISFTAAEDACNVTVQEKQYLKPAPSVQNGATFLSASFLGDTNQCHQGCCSSSRCDTSFHTGDRIDKKGDNCFYFQCSDSCKFAKAHGEGAGNFSISQILSVSNELPDFSGMFTGAPKSENSLGKAVENSTKADEVDNGVILDKPDADESKVSDSAPSATGEADKAAPLVNNTLSVEDNEQNKEETNIKPSSEAPKSGATSTESDRVKEEVPLKADTTTELKTTTQPPKVATVKDNAEKPPTSAPEAPAKQESSDVNTDTKPVEPAPVDTTEEEPSKPATDAPEPEASLPGEVPVVKNPVADTSEPVVDRKIGESDGAKEEVTKDITDKQSNVAAADKPETDTKPDTVVSMKTPDIEVEVEVEATKDGPYTKRDIVFWIAVIGGSSLIVMGLFAVARVYRGKRRRLYSSLTDDYLINGMYSI